MGPICNIIAKILPVFKQIFPVHLLEQLWREAQPKNYHYKVHPTEWPLVLICCFIGRVANIQEIINLYGEQLGVHSKSTFSGFLANPAFERFVGLMLEHFEFSKPLSEDISQDCWLAAEDTVALTLANTAKSNALATNNNTIGVAMTWQLYIDAQPGACPFHLTKISHGAWNDANIMLEVPGVMRRAFMTCLFDRGFSSHRVIERWLAEHDNLSAGFFIMRLRVCEVQYWKRVKRVSRRTRVGELKVLEDCIAKIGKQVPVKVRLVWAQTQDGEPLILATNHLDWSAEQILEAYKKRWQIETVHKLIKDSIGLAHLYSFQRFGMSSLMQLALLLAGLLWVDLADPLVAKTKGICKAIRQALNFVRKQLFKTASVWKRNICASRYHGNQTKKKRNKQAEKKTSTQTKPKGKTDHLAAQQYLACPG